MSSPIKMQYAPSWPPLAPPPLAPPNLPCEDLIAIRYDYITICIPLYEASITGDWKAAMLIFNKHPEYVRFAITENYETALHVAASADETKQIEHFVKNLVNLMTQADLELQNTKCNTAFFLACAAGNLKLIEIMMEKNGSLPDIPGRLGMMPLYMSALKGKYNTVKNLYYASAQLTGDKWTQSNRGLLLHKCVECDFFDIALQIVTDRPDINDDSDNASSVLESVARKVNAFNGVKRSLFMRITSPLFKIMNVNDMAADDEDDTDALRLLNLLWRYIFEKMPPIRPTQLDNGAQRNSFRMLFVAAEMGNTRFVVELLRAYPDLIWQKNDDGISIFHIAVMHRRRGIYKLLNEIGPMKDLIWPLVDKDGNNMLHLVGKTSKKMRSQEAKKMRSQKSKSSVLVMQRDLLWLKEIQKTLPPTYMKRKNKAGETPYDIFSRENADLVGEGLNRMKECMVVPTLIITVAFAVAFTVPGGYNQETGIPLFMHGSTLLVFIIADAISFFASLTSLIVFLSVLTSHHDERDFMNYFPKELTIGLVSLFVSMSAMMVTFIASFFVLYHNGLKWVPILIATFAVMPVFVFPVRKFPLWLNMIRFLLDSQYLFHPKKRMLHNTNPRDSPLSARYGLLVEWIKSRGRAIQQRFHYKKSIDSSHLMENA